MREDAKEFWSWLIICTDFHIFFDKLIYSEASLKEYKKRKEPHFILDAVKPEILYFICVLCVCVGVNSTKETYWICSNLPYREAQRGQHSHISTL